MKPSAPVSPGTGEGRVPRASSGSWRGEVLPPSGSSVLTPLLFLIRATACHECHGHHECRGHDEWELGLAELEDEGEPEDDGEWLGEAEEATATLIVTWSVREYS